jgi:hypothetical protein
MAAWMAHWQADDDLARYYVTRAVKSSWLVDRGERAGEALVIKNMNGLAGAAEERDAEEVEQLTTQLADRPAATIRRLRKTLAGCSWIRGQLLILQEPVSQYIRLYPSQRTLAINLLGKSVHDVFRDDPLVRKWALALLGTQESPGRGDFRGVSEALGGPPAWMSMEEFSVRITRLIDALVSPQRSTELLQGYIAEALAELDEHMEYLAEIAEHDRALDEAAARMDLAVSGKQILNHVVAYSRSRDSAVNRLDKMKEPPRPGRGPGRGSRQAATEAPAATRSIPADDPAVATAGVTTETRPAAGTEATTGIEPALETAPEYLPATALPAPAVESATSRPISRAESAPAVESATSRPISRVESAPAMESATSRPISRVESEGEASPARAISREKTHVDRGCIPETTGLAAEIQGFVLDQLHERNRQINELLDAEERERELRGGPGSMADWNRRFAAAMELARSEREAVRAPPGGDAPSG